MNRSNFYDSLLEQDGHNLYKIIPPKNLQAWRTFPVSSIINPKPIIITDMTPSHMKELFSRYNYKRYPAVIDGTFQGILARKTAETAMEKGEQPELIPAPSCRIDQTIGEVAETFMTATIGMVIVKNRDDTIAGLLTLHDLLRAEATLAEDD